MYKQKQTIARNYFEIEDLPFFKLETFNLNPTITYSKMMHVRNITHHYKHLIAKIYAFWLEIPTSVPQQNQINQNIYPQVATVVEPHILSLESLTYLYHDLLKQNKISKEEWNMVGKLEEFKLKGGKIIEEILMAEYQIKLKQKVEKITYGVYYDQQKDQYHIKGALKISQFQVSPSFSKKKYQNDFVKGLSISNPVVKEAIRQRYYLQRMKFFNNIPLTREEDSKFNAKYENFYSKQMKYMDEQILQLQVYHNFPALRSKSFVPVEFVDQFDGLPLVGPIFSNSNPHCMFNHFIGYNWNSCLDSRSVAICDICHIQIKQLKRNYLLQFLRDNPYNVCKSTIQYIPQYNRFRLMKKRDDKKRIQKMQEDIKKLSLDSDNKTLHMQEQQEQQKIRQPTLEIKYAGYMHLLSFLKKVYTKNRMKIFPTKDVEHVKLMFSLGDNKYFQYELMEPVRGKNCNHLEFADLRKYYESMEYKSNGFISEPYFRCPICQNQLKDSELIYLKQVLPAVKLLLKQMYDTSEQEYFLGENPHKDREVDGNSAQVIINNSMQKVFIEFRYSEQSHKHHYFKQIQNLYPTLIDPYIHFSEYGLGLKSHKAGFFSMLDEKKEKYEEIIRQFEKKWYNFQSEKLTL